MFRRRDRIEVKTSEELLLMRRAGLVVARALREMAAATAPGVTTADLAALARDVLREEGATSSFLGYHGFPAVLCASVNDEVVHGIPGPRVLAEGDLVSLDFGAIVEGWHGDAAVTVPVGAVAPEHLELSAVTEDALWAGLARAVVGGRLSDIGNAVETTVRARGSYGIVEEYVGHGIGSAMHMEPNVPNYGPRAGPRSRAGMALAVEPQVVLGLATCACSTTTGPWSPHAGPSPHWEAPWRSRPRSLGAHRRGRRLHSSRSSAPRLTALRGCACPTGSGESVTHRPRASACGHDRPLPVDRLRPDLRPARRGVASPARAMSGMSDLAGAIRGVGGVRRRLAPRLVVSRPLACPRGPSRGCSGAPAGGARRRPGPAVPTGSAHAAAD
jgi:methionyl aminopeptidase